jgi:hypothetical protein
MFNLNNNKKTTTKNVSGRRNIKYRYTVDGTVLSLLQANYNIIGFVTQKIKLRHL